MPELQQNQFQKRQIAYKVRISDILSISLDNTNISRVNIIATVVFKSEHGNVPSIIIDDGTGKILLRNFENTGIFSKVDVGDFVLAIGKAREFNGEKYILAEILRKIYNAEWVNVRKLELKNLIYNIQNAKPENTAVEETISNKHDEVYSLIRNLDSGEGVLVDEVIRKSSNDKTEKIISSLLESGDIFEISPGKLKVLE